MKVEQIYQFVGDIYTEVTGQESPLQENLSNIVDVGNAVLSNEYREKYVNAMLNRIGRMVFVDRPYDGIAPRILREGWEWGSIMSKSRTKDFTAVANPSWSLTRGQSVDQYVYEPPTVQTTLYNEMVTWEIDCSFVNRQLKQSFKSASEMDRFLSMIRSQINNNENQQIDSLTMRAINAMMGRRLAKNIAVIDLLAGYNNAFSTNLTPSQAVTSKDFARYAAYEILLYKDRIKAKTAVFSENESGYTTFTPSSYLHLILLSDIAKSMDVYLQSETFHNSFTDIGTFDTVPFWQASGNSFAIADTSRLNIVVPGLTSGNVVNRNYVIGCMFDRDAAGIINEERRVEVAYNARGEYWNNFFKVDTRLFTDPAENCIVFTIGSGTIPAVTVSSMDPSAEVFGYTVSDLQSGVTVSGNKITGTLNYINSGSLVPTWGAGNFIALNFTDIPAGATVKVGLSPSEGSGLVPLDDDHAGVFKITDKYEQRFKVVTTLNGDSTAQLFDLSGLTLQTS